MLLVSNEMQKMLHCCKTTDVVKQPWSIFIYELSQEYKNMREGFILAQA